MWDLFELKGIEKNRYIPVGVVEMGVGAGRTGCVELAHCGKFIGVVKSG